MRISDWSSDVCSSDLSMTTASTATSSCHFKGASIIASHIARLSAWIALGRLSEVRPTRTSVAVMRSSVIQKVLRDGPSLRSVPPQDERKKREPVCAEEPLSSSKWRLEASLAQQVPSDDHPPQNGPGQGRERVCQDV